MYMDIKTKCYVINSCCVIFRGDTDTGTSSDVSHNRRRPRHIHVPGPISGRCRQTISCGETLILYNLK